jgi:hypothetical protein
MREVSYKKKELFTSRKSLDLPPGFGGVHVAHLFSLLCCALCFVCVHPVSCVLNIACVSGLSILDCPIGFL